ncbi:MAG: hypothetical protein SVC26_07645 [Pseudomonadota bacterium]|nr:hypothetical protein [Pseudomonadota bacterium]
MRLASAFWALIAVAFTTLSFASESIAAKSAATELPSEALMLKKASDFVVGSFLTHCPSTLGDASLFEGALKYSQFKQLDPSGAKARHLLGENSGIAVHVNKDFGGFAIVLNPEQQKCSIVAPAVDMAYAWEKFKSTLPNGNIGFTHKLSETTESAGLTTYRYEIYKKEVPIALWQLSVDQALNTEKALEITYINKSTNSGR